MPKSFLRRAGALVPLAVVTAGAGVLGLAPAAVAAPWGTAGASYSGGIVCRLPGDTSVPMARWSVGGTSAFSTADVVRTGPAYGPAPTGGTAAPITPGQAGLSATDIAAAAYLIDHHGTGPAAEVAETSADVAALAGGGSAQARCLGQQGTSSAHAAALLATARRDAGPYTVQVGAPSGAVSASRVPVSATVRSASGALVGGLRVQFRAGADSAATTTDDSGVARATLPAQRAADVALVATVSAVTSLLYVDSSPAALAAGAPVDYSGTGRLAAVSPKPVVSVTGSADLVLAGGRATPTAQVAGTFGYSGTGAMTVSGPVRAPSGKGCSALTGDAFASAPEIWTAPFSFTGDGAHDAGATPGLSPGCYVARSSVTTTDSTPPVRAASTVDGSAIFNVVATTLSQVNATTVAPAGGLRATVTALSPGKASVSSTLIARGPLATPDGDCAAATGWADAPVAATSDPVTLTPTAGPTSPGSTGSGTPIRVGTPGAAPPSAADGDPSVLRATLSTPTVDRVGCYSLVSRSVVTLDGRSVTVEGRAGASGSTTLVAAPRVTITNNDYDGEVGQPMTGTVTVSGTYRFAGTVTIGLIARTPPEGGCHPVSFPDRRAAATPTDTVTKGDGTYAFASPKPSRNVCYSITAVVHLKVNDAVRSASPSPSADTTFLAGVRLQKSSLAEIPGLADTSLLRPVLTMGLAYGLLFAITVFVFVRTWLGRRNVPTR